MLRTPSTGNPAGESPHRVGWFEHEGEEFVYVLEGSITIELRDHEPTGLSVGDSAWYPSDVPHRWVAAQHPVRVLAVSSIAERAVRTEHGH